MKNKILNSIKEHGIALFLSVIVGMISILIFLIPIFNIGFENFKGFYPIFVRDSAYYLTRTNAASLGNYGNAYYFEHIHDNYVQPPFAELLLSKIADIFHLSITTFYFINSVILITVNFLLIYYLFFLITNSKLASNIATVFYYFIFLCYFFRFINPQFSYILFTIGLILIWKIFLNEKNIKKIAIYNFSFAVIFVLLFYIYLYYWTVLITVYCLSLAACAYFGRRIKEVLLNFTTFLIFSLFGILPYVFNSMAAGKSQSYIDAIKRFGMVNNHWPSGYFTILFILLAGLILFLSRNRMEKKYFIFSSVLLISGIIFNWQNVITGKNLFLSNHYIQQSFFFIITVLLMIITKIKKDNKKNNLFLLACLSLLIVMTIYIEPIKNIKSELRIDRQTMQNLQKINELAVWLNQNTEKNSVILDYGIVSGGYLPVVAHNNLYFFGMGGVFLVSDDEIEDRWVRYNIFNDQVDYNYIKQRDREIWIYKYMAPYQNREVRRKIWKKISGKDMGDIEYIPDADIDRVLNKYYEVRKQDAETALKKYRIDYIIVNKENEQYDGISNMIENQNFVQKIKEINGNIIYKVL